MVLLPNGIVQLEIQDKFSLTGRETDATSADGSYIQVLDGAFGGNLVLKLVLFYPYGLVVSMGCEIGGPKPVNTNAK